MAALSGCSSAGYYWQAASGHLGVLRKQVPIETAINSPETSPALREKLRHVLAIRQFAKNELHLPVGDHYSRYADLQRRYVVWTVHAAPEFSLEAHTWWYPLVGRLKYRGYFLEKEARALAATMTTQGMDASVSGVEAYSTLGLLKDPVLSTFTHHLPANLAEILFHELTHQKLFISGDTDFNEAFAVAVAQEGVRRWLRRHGAPGDYESYEADLKKERRFNTLVQNTLQSLGELYASSATESVETRRQLKQSRIQRMKEAHEALRSEWGGTSPYDPWFTKPINNARLNTVTTYHELVPGFHRLMEQEGGDLDRLFLRVKALGRLPPAARRRALSSP